MNTIFENKFDQSKIHSGTHRFRFEMNAEYVLYVEVQTNGKQWLEETVEYVKEEMSSNDSSHDFHHIERVRRLAKTIAIEEGLTQTNRLVTELGALLHDLKDINS